MDDLYYKHITKGGRTYYHPAFTFWAGNPADGLWYVKQEQHSHKQKWICERLEDLPQARKMAELEPYRDKIVQEIETLQGRSLDDIITAIFKVLVR